MLSTPAFAQESFLEEGEIDRIIPEPVEEEYVIVNIGDEQTPEESGKGRNLFLSKITSFVTKPINKIIDTTQNVVNKVIDTT